MLEVITSWQGPGASPKLSIMYFGDPPAAIADVRDAVGDLWRGYNASLSNLYQWTVQTSGRVLDEATGTLTGMWTDTTPQTQQGAASTGPIPDASQVLYQWNTSTIINGRLVKGRTFVPGLSTSLVAIGNIAGATLTTLREDATEFVENTLDFGVWHRPNSGSANGEFVSATGGTVWNELAVQRKRRG